VQLLKKAVAAGQCTTGCVRERGERQYVCVCERENVCVCLCKRRLCVGIVRLAACERERDEREYVRERERRERVRERERETREST